MTPKLRIKACMALLASTPPRSFADVVMVAATMAGQVLCAAGDLVEDVVVHLGGPIRAAADTTSRIRRRRGGSAANVAAFAARAGATARFVGRVGADALGDALIADLERAGVDVRVQRGGATGTVVALVAPDGERTMLTDRGAAADLFAPNPSWLEDVAVLHVPAYALCRGASAASIECLAEWARAARVRVSMDVSSTTVLADLGLGAFLALLVRMRPSVLFANEPEAAALGIAVEAPLPDGVACAVRHGPSGATVLEAGRPAVSVPVPQRLSAYDTTGAGDAFAAGFLVASMRGAATANCALAGHRTAAAAIEDRAR
jgi:sugar/nucleoside kinase (ribokinase family)